MLLRLLPLFALVCASCASGKVQPNADGSSVERVLTDTFGDLDAALVDEGVDLPIPPDLGCVLGTVDHCAHCGDRCPGQDSDTLKRSCIDGQCALACREEYYDVNGKVDDGCEILDDAPLHASEKDAIKFGDASDCDLGDSASAKLPSDGRMHVAVPHERPNGRPDYFSIKLSDDMLCDLVGEVTLSLTEMSPDSEYRVTTEYFCKNATPTAPRVTSGKGGTSFKNVPDTACNPFGWGDDGGLLVIKVEKIGGPHNAADYSLTVVP